MLTIHLYGELRKLAEDSAATSQSVVKVTFKENEDISDLLHRLGINQTEVGELFVNHHLADFDTIIPQDGSRIGIFSQGMYLLDGGQHLKGHGFIETHRKKGNYY